MAIMMVVVHSKSTYDFSSQVVVGIGPRSSIMEERKYFENKGTADKLHIFIWILTYEYFGVCMSYTIFSGRFLPITFLLVNTCFNGSFSDPHSWYREFTGDYDFDQTGKILSFK